jgi:sulfate adenylyltransferase subunit 1 (EFTu-like GTPase family)
VSPSGLEAHVTSLRVGSSQVLEASAPRSVGITLDRDIDVARGDIIAHQYIAPVNSFKARVTWFDAIPLNAGKRFALKAGTRTVRAVITQLHSRLNVATLTHEPAETFQLNDIGEIECRLQVPLALDAYRQSRATGSFILIDEATNRTVAGGMVV